MTKEELENTEVELTKKQQLIEIMGNAIAILMLFAFFLKILFF